MAVVPNPQRVALGTVNRDGTVTIAREWLRFFEQAVGTTAPSGGGSGDFAALAARVSAVENDIADLKRRVAALEMGYHL